MVDLIWSNEQEHLPIDDTLIETLTACMEHTLKTEDFADDVEISLTFTNNEGIHEYNLSARGIDRPTDVLSFPLLECEADGTLILYDENIIDGKILLGDIVISTEKAMEQAEEYGHSLLRELCFLTVHSMLHLLGYDHERGEAEEAEMFEKQERILQDLRITR